MGYLCNSGESAILYFNSTPHIYPLYPVRLLHCSAHRDWLPPLKVMCHSACASIVCMQYAYCAIHIIYVATICVFTYNVTDHWCRLNCTSPVESTRWLTNEQFVDFNWVLNKVTSWDIYNVMLQVCPYCVYYYCIKILLICCHSQGHRATL